MKTLPREDFTFSLSGVSFFKPPSEKILFMKCFTFETIPRKGFLFETTLQGGLHFKIIPEKRSDVKPSLQNETTPKLKHPKQYYL